MPIYEYVCEEDGTRVELLRSMADADKPVDDPDKKGRRFVRVQSVFQAKGAGPAAGGGGGGGGCCPCGKSAGSCSSRA
jgi:putative FmdB family regulatory protein